MMTIGIAQGFGEKAECAQIGGHLLAISLRRRCGGIKKGRDTARHRIRAAGGLVVSEQTKSTADLPQQRAKREQVGPGSGIPEKRIEHPLAGTQIDLQFTHESLQREAGLRSTRELGQPLGHRLGVALLSLTQGIEPRGQLSRAPVVLINLGWPALQGLLDKEQGGGEFK